MNRKIPGLVQHTRNSLRTNSDIAVCYWAAAVVVGN